MTRQTFQSFFESSPEVFRRFNALVDNPGTFHSFLQTRGYLNDVRAALSIGAGEGGLEVRLMSEHGMELGYIDPTAPYLAQYREAVRARRLESLAVETFHGTFQDYRPTRTFDLVLAIHSWYAIGTDETQLQKALDCRRPGGTLFIALASETSFDVRWAHLVNPEQHLYVTAEKLSTWARERGHSHELVHCQRKVLLKTLLADRAFTPDGEVMCAFFARRPFEQIRADERASIAELLVSAQKDGVLTQTIGCLVFQKDAVR